MSYISESSVSTDPRYINFIGEQLRYKVDIAFPAQRGETIMIHNAIGEVEARALEWIVENVDCLWSLERHTTGYSTTVDFVPMLRYSFSDLSTAALFRLKF